MLSFVDFFFWFFCLQKLLFEERESYTNGWSSERAKMSSGIRAKKKGMFLGSVFSLVIGGWIKQKVFTTKRYLQPPSLRERVFFVLFHLFCGGDVTRCDFFFFNIFVFVVVQEYAALHAGSVELLQK